jgi:uncharacterized protein
MIIDLRELTEPRGRIEGDVSTRIDDPVAGERVVPCHVAVDYRQTQGMFYLHGVVDGDFGTTCHRCLEPVTERVTGDFDVMVRRGEHTGEEGEDVITLASHEHLVPVEPLVHETLVVNLPMIVVCRDDCRGLCPACGTNLNTGSCTCAQTGDPRWDTLRRMKSE